VPEIEIEGLSKRFGAVQALADVDLEVDRGEVVALVGPNGSGKSTLLRVLGTTVLPDAGRVRVCGRDVEAEPAATRRDAGMMLGDERSWYWRISGRRNLEFFAALHGMRRAERTSRAAELLQEFDLTDVADRPFSGYSSGMRVRLSLARALLADPAVLLLDEPTHSLDPVAAGHFRDLVDGLVRERQATILFATHDLREAAAVANRVIGLAAGRVAFTEGDTADPDELQAALTGASG